MSQTTQSDLAMARLVPDEIPMKSVKSKREAPAASKTDIVLKKLRGAKGASVQQLSEATGWQVHSVRGFLSAIVRKKLQLTLVSDVGKDDVRRYRISGDAGNSSS